MFRRRLIIKLQQLIFDLNDSFPLMGKPLLRGWSIFHRLKFIFGKYSRELRGKLNYSVLTIDLNKIFWVNPEKINLLLDSKVRTPINDSKILRGNWDRSTRKYTDSEIYKSFKQRYKDGIIWEKTIYYNNLLHETSKLKKKKMFESKEELDNKFNKFDHLYNHLKNLKIEKKFNYHRWAEIVGNQSITDEIVVNIGRNGQLLLIEGQSLLFLTKILNFKHIPIKIRTRHKKWIKFKKDLEYFSRQGKLYQKIEHPDLQNFPFKYGDTRLKLIEEKISRRNGTLLDIGANLGYFCHNFEDLGFDCYAIEVNPIYIYFLKKLKKAESKKFKIITDSIFCYKKNDDLIFDIVLALNVFHNLIIRKKTYLKLIKFLNRLKVKELYFGAHNPNELKNIYTYRNFTPNQFTNFILKNSDLNNVEFIGKTSDGRTLYKLT
ncbi:MAG: hypothetical protein ACFFHD_00145 [Promethearchaeota archaeon]